jgi:hypothetical protein
VTQPRMLVVAGPPGLDIARDPARSADAGGGQGFSDLANEPEWTLMEAWMDGTHDRAMLHL